MRENSSGIGVLDKAIALLEAAREGATLMELTEQSGISRATAHRIASALEFHRLLMRDHTGRWRPGPRLTELGRNGSNTLLTAAVPVLAALRDETGESAQLYVRRGNERVCVVVAERRSGLRDTVPLGAVLPLTAGSAAHVLLAWETSGDAAGLLRNARFSARTLAEVRRRGWAASLAEREPGVASVSAPVRNESGRVIAAISISGPIQRLTRSPGPRFGPIVGVAAEKLSGEQRP